MVKKLLGLPLRAVKKILGKEKPAAAPSPRPAPRPAPRPRPETGGEGGGGHDHGHSHGGGGHDHGHDHGGAREDRGHDHGHDHGGGHDHGHDHGGGHDHGHSHGESRASAKAAPAPDDTIGADIRVDVSDTPNPNARKFTCSVTVIEKGSLSFNAADEAASHPIGRHVWAVGGVKGIFAVKDFVTVTKAPEADWGQLTPKIIPAVRRGLVERGI
jgi:hypothetical protein